MADTYGKILKITLFGESHSESIGVVVDGFPAGVKLDMEFINAEMARRAPGRDSMSTPRKEADTPYIKSGFFEGRTTGTPLCAVIDNTNTRSQDYDRDLLRPSHADYTGKLRYGGWNDFRGGGHFSGRLTAPLVFAGALCKQYLKEQGIAVFAHLASVKDVHDAEFDLCGPDISLSEQVRERELPVLEEAVIGPMKEAILTAKQAGDSVGGVVECAVCGVPAGIGSPFFESVESRLASMLFSVPAVKGVEFGLGFAIAKMNGSEANDPFILEKGVIRTATNNNGGINGGITNGMPIVFRTAIKPTPSIGMEQDTVRFGNAEACKTRMRGRHDPCIAHRAVCVVEAAAAIVITDLYLEAKTYAR